MTQRANVIEIQSRRHEAGCGHSARVWHTITMTYSDGTLKEFPNFSTENLNRLLVNFGADRNQQYMTGCWGGTLVRDMETLEVSPNEITASGWAKR